MNFCKISCECGLVDSCTDETELYEHGVQTICVRGCFSNGCKWFRNESIKGHFITFSREDNQK